MRRITLMSLLASLFVLSLAACGRDDPPPPPAEQPAPTAAQAAPTSEPPPAPMTPAGPVAQGEVDTDGDLTPQERAAIAAQRADGKESTDDDGTDAQGNVRSHTEAETAAAEETDTPEEHEIDDDEDDRHE